jgi:hypothetical protein
MLAWSVMPNDVHVLVHIWRTPLSKLERSWKQFVQTEANRAVQERRPPARRKGWSAGLRHGSELQVAFPDGQSHG